MMASRGLLDLRVLPRGLQRRRFDLENSFIPRVCPSLLTERRPRPHNVAQKRLADQKEGALTFVLASSSSRHAIDGTGGSIGSSTVLQRRFFAEGPKPWGLVGQRAVSFPARFLPSPGPMFWPGFGGDPGKGRTVRTQATGSKKKGRRVWVCEECGEDEGQWWGACRHCGAAGSLKEMFLAAEEKERSGGGAAQRLVGKLSEAAVGARSAGSGRGGTNGRSGSDVTRNDRDSGVFRNHQSVGGGAGNRVKGWVKQSAEGPRRLSEILEQGADKGWRIQLRGAAGAEVSRVLGGGIVPGSLILVSGDPGVGKSTLMLQLAAMIAGPDDYEMRKEEEEEEERGSKVGEATMVDHDEYDDDMDNESGIDDEDEERAADGGFDEHEAAAVLYVSGEESVEQVKLRANRMSLRAHHLFLYNENNLERILEEVYSMKPRALIMDSIQTIFLPEVTGSVGSTSQVKECAMALLHAAKQINVPIFIVGHVTKQGDIAGPMVLEHIVDVVLYMEGEGLQSHRLLRSVKNRHGATDEVGVFEMTRDGLAAVTNPSQIFLSHHHQHRSSSSSDSSLDDGGSSSDGGSAAVAVVMQGTRPLLLEVQALCSPSSRPPGNRVLNGIDSQRFMLLTGVLSKRLGLALYTQDIFVNVVGGLQLKEPAADLAIVAAIASSFCDRSIPLGTAFIGEVGLRGEIRSVGRMEQRINEAAKLGFSRCFVAASAVKAPSTSRSTAAAAAHASASSAPNEFPPLQVIPCSTVADVLAELKIDEKPKKSR